jgi:2-polyprenyl-3-methyl-5-hydroxy-6-metoxy-1,4-benzoquinol methylase
MEAPDQNSLGLLTNTPHANRYENASIDPDNVGAKLAVFIPKNSRILDVGCGTGSVSEVIKKLTGATLVCIEPNPERAQAARDRGLTVFQGFLSDSFVEEHGPFDAVVFADVLEHLSNPAELVLMAKKGLKPGGSIVASVPNVAHWFVRIDLLAGHFDYQDCGIMDATHLRWFTRRSIREFFERLEFQVTGFDCTVNIELPDYRRRAPWRWMSVRFRKMVVRRLVVLCPNLFGCQHIVRATIPK